MSILYSDNVQKPDHGFDLTRANATNQYLKHFANVMYLKFIANESKDPREKIQAAKEILIGERKMRFWERHPNYIKSVAEQEIKKIRDQWNSPRSK